MSLRHQWESNSALIGTLIFIIGFGSLMWYSVTYHDDIVKREQIRQERLQEEDSGVPGRTLRRAFGWGW